MIHARRWIRYGLISGLTMIVCLMVSFGHQLSVAFPAHSDLSFASLSSTPSLTLSPTPSLTLMAASAPSDGQLVNSLVNSTAWLEQGRSQFEAGQYENAASSLQRAVQQAQVQGNPTQQTIALSNLSLVFQAMGRWTEAGLAIAQSLDILEPQGTSDVSLLAQVLDVQGRLQFAQGNSQQALATWEQALAFYKDADDHAAVIRVGINRAEAMQEMGLYRRAIATLTELVQSLDGGSASTSYVVTLRSLGDALRVSGELDQAQQVLVRSFELATELQDAEQIARCQLSLGNVAYAKGELADAQTAYEQVALEAPSSLLRAHAQLNQLHILADRWGVDLFGWAKAEPLITEVSAALDEVPPTVDAIALRINLAKTLLTLASNPDSASQGNPNAVLEITSEHLVTAYRQAQTLGNTRSEAIALATLGELYETTQQLKEAQELTQNALNLIQSRRSDDIAYQLHWQLGRIYSATGDRDAAIAEYEHAVTLLQSLRNDLIAISSDAQYSFRTGVEPVYRQLVSLLLEPTRTPTALDLEKARNTIELLQLAELDNFFREACLDTTEVSIDTLDAEAAVLYPIILSDRLEVIISLPNAQTGARTLQHHTVPVSASQVRTTVNALIQFLRQPSANWRSPPLAHQVYDWLIRPSEAAFQEHGVETLAFVLDGVLRNLPMAALQEGETYLIEKYAIALTPGLQLFSNQSSSPAQFSVLLGGLSEPRQQFPGLPGVKAELADIQAQFPQSQVLLNESFTNAALQNAINQSPFPVVHLATHGEFSSTLTNTFILTWSDRLNINQLNQTLKASELSRDRPIELLVLSACQTAEGDDLAALGLAGMAVRAGARSTVATLWQLSDEASPKLMQSFYRELRQPETSKAKALQRAQLALLHDPVYQRPYFWSPVVLVGNWL